MSQDKPRTREEEKAFIRRALDMLDPYFEHRGKNKGKLNATRLCDELDRLRAEVERLERERDAALRAIRDLFRAYRRDGGAPPTLGRPEIAAAVERCRALAGGEGE